MEEARVISLVRAGEVDAFAEIIENYQAPIIRYLYRLTGDYEMARDLAQDTFLQAYRGILKTDAELSFRAWLYRIATNSALQHREDLKDDPSSADPEGFRDRHLKDLQEQRWWVLWERDRIVFQVHVGAENDHTVQLGGVMTPPDLRNCGYATRGLGGIVRQLLERRPAVSLFCDEANLAARRLYEKLGFRNRFYYRSWLLEAEDASE